MADGPSRDAMATIDELLAQREQFAAWIAKIEASDLNAQGNEVAIESVELAHEGLELDD